MGNIRKEPVMKNQSGIIAIIVGICMVVLIGFGALAIDVWNLYARRGELQNAADAGALAGARALYNSSGTAINTGANQEANVVATLNKSAGVAVDVNTGDVQRGHWRFATRTFFANSSTIVYDFVGKTFQQLDEEDAFINAVKVTTRREATPVAAFLARIFGYKDFELSADAVAYRGFVGSAPPGYVDQPIAICEESITDSEGAYTCNIGRMFNSGEKNPNKETAAWTDYNQDKESVCSGANNPGVGDAICSESPQIDGGLIAVTNGVLADSFKNFIECWESNSQNKTVPWEVTLPVVKCKDSKTTCKEVVGAVTVNIVWITGVDKDPQGKDAPTKMDAWENYDPDGKIRWEDFTETFNLLDIDGESNAPYTQKSIYFLPDCDPQDPFGTTGGGAFNILAEIPVLVD
jgi:Flp pilus assembly protein TadG